MSENIANAASTRRPDGTHRVVITGMGAVSPAGVGVQALWDAVMGRACCIGPVTRFDTADYDVHIAAEVRDFDATEHGITKKEARRFERFVQYAIVASDEALAQSGLNLEAEDTARIACVFGTGIGGIDELQSGFFTLAEKGPKRVSPLFIPTMIGNIAAGNLSIRYGLRGECLNVVTACATGAHSIGAAVRDIRHGYIDAALAGGSEESVSPICLAGFSNLGALSKAEDPTQASLPFDVRRAGFVAGEGAGAVVLESLEHALERGATVLAEITGFGSTGDAYHMTAPEPSGEGGARDAPGAGGRRLHAGRPGASERARHRHAGQRLHRVQGAAGAVRRGGGIPDPGDVGEGHDGPHAGRRGRHRGHRHGLVRDERLRAAHGRLRRGRSGMPGQRRHGGEDGLSSEGGAVELARIRRP